MKKTLNWSIALLCGFILVASFSSTIAAERYTNIINRSTPNHAGTAGTSFDEAHTLSKIRFY